MKKPINENYAGIVSKVSRVVPIEGMDRITYAYVLGNGVVVIGYVTSIIGVIVHIDSYKWLNRTSISGSFNNISLKYKF